MAKRVITDNPAQGLFNKSSEKEPTDPARGSTTPIPQPQPQETPATGQPASVVVVVPPKKESRSKKKLFLFEPSLYEEIEAKCREMGISMNEAANQLFRAWLGE